MAFNTGGALGGAGSGAALGTAIAPGIGTAIGAVAGGLLGGFGSGGGDDPRILHSNPSAGFIGNLFGLGTRVTSTGGIEFNKDASRKMYQSGGTMPGRYAYPLFTPETSQLINDYIKSPIPLTGLEQGGVAFANTGDPSQLPGIYGEAFQQAYGGTNELQQGAIPALLNLIQTGGLGGMQGLAQQRLGDFIDSTAERFNPAEGTSLPSLSAREAQRLQVEMENAALDRQLQAIGALPGLQGSLMTQAGFPLAYLNDIMGAGATVRGAQESVRPGQRLFQALLELSGMPSQTITQGVNPNSGTSDLLGALGSIAPFLLSAGGDAGRIDESGALGGYGSYDPFRAAVGREPGMSTTLNLPGYTP